MQSPTGKREVCQVPGCLADLSTEAKRYCWHKRICSKHMQDDTLIMHTPEGGEVLRRFCFQCGKLHDLTDFDGKQKSCRAKLFRRRDRFKAAKKPANVWQQASSPAAAAGAGAAAAAEARAAATYEEAVAAAAASASAAAACSTLAINFGSPHANRATTEDLNLMQQQQQPSAAAASFEQLLCQLIEEELEQLPALPALPDTPAAACISSLSCPAAHHGFESGWLHPQQPLLGTSFPSSSSFGSTNSQADAAAPWGQQLGHSPAAACPWAGGSGDLASRMPLLRLGSRSAPDLLRPEAHNGVPLASTAATAAAAGGGVGTPAAPTAAAAAALSAGFFEPGAFQTSQQAGCSTQPFAATAALQHPLLAPPPPATAAGAGVFPAGLTSTDGLSWMMPPAAVAQIQGHSAQPAHTAAPPLPPPLPLVMPQQQQQQQWEQQSERERQRECYRSLAAQLATMEANLKSLEHTLTAAMAISAT